MNARAWRQVWSEHKREIVIYVIVAIALLFTFYAQHNAPPISEEEAHVYDMPP